MKNKPLMVSSMHWAKPIVEELKGLLAGNKRPFLFVKLQPVLYDVQKCEKFFGNIIVVNMSIAGEFREGILTPRPVSLWDEKTTEPAVFSFEVKFRNGTTRRYDGYTLEDVKRTIKWERT